MEKSKKLRTLRVIDEKGPVAGMLNGFLSIFQQVFPSPISEASYIIRKDIEKTGLSNELSLSERIKAFQCGFTTEKYRWYGFDESDDCSRSYISELSVNSIRDNLHKNTEYLFDKKKFIQYCKNKEITKYIPKLLGKIDNGELKSQLNLKSLLKENDKLVFKPRKGSKGRDIYFLEMGKNHILVNGKIYSLREIKDLIGDLDNYLILEYCEQADFLKKIFPDSPNTLRILTIYPEKEKPYMVHAFLRIGTKRSQPVDNLSQGGLTSEIDLEKGKLSKAAQFFPGGELKWHKKHPDTGFELEGFEIPNWETIKKKLQRVFSELYDFNLVIWDVLITNDESFVIIEGNNKAPGFRGHQVHYPLLRDSNFKEFLMDKKVKL